MEKLLYDLIDKMTNTGKIFSVLFTKKNGDERKMVGRRGVQIGLKGVGIKYDLREKNLINVYDMQARDYRCFNTNSIKEIKVNGVVVTKDELVAGL